MPDYNFMQQTPLYPAGQWGTSSFRGGAPGYDPYAMASGVSGMTIPYGGNPYAMAASAPPTFMPNMGAPPAYNPGPVNYSAPSANQGMYQQLMDYFRDRGFFSVDNWLNEAWRANIGKSASENFLFPMLQYLQNQNQWRSEFAESVRRENEAANWQRYTDTFGMGLSEAQQKLNEWAAGTAAEQWTKEHGFAVDKFAKEFGLTEEQARHAMGLATRGQEFTESSWGKEFGLKERQQQAAEEQWGKEFGLAERKQTAEEKKWAEEHGFEKTKWGEQLGFEKEKWGGQLGLEQSRLAQEKELAEKQRASQELQSRYSAFGRAQAPKVQWTRSW